MPKKEPLMWLLCTALNHIVWHVCAWFPRCCWHQWQVLWGLALPRKFSWGPLFTKRLGAQAFHKQWPYCPSAQMTLGCSRSLQSGIVDLWGCYCALIRAVRPCYSVVRLDAVGRHRGATALRMYRQDTRVGAS
jgi:hypothetical protein